MKGKLDVELSESRVAIVTHVFTIGPTHELERFLKDRCKKLVVIGHPFYNSSVKRTYYRIYEGGSVKNFESRLSRKQPIVDFMLDLAKTLVFFMVGHRQIFDLFVGAGTLNAFAGLMLRNIGIVRKVAFYSIDYVPKRFENPLMNKIYHWMDRQCASKCDAVWNLSDRMIQERHKRGINIQGNLQQIVPVGADFEEIKRLPIDRVDRHMLVYLGTLAEKQGLQLALEAMPTLLERHPGLKLVVIGDGPFRITLERMCSSLGVSRAVDFRGEIKDGREVEAILSKGAAGIATYKPEPDNFAQFTDVGKPKYYAACGLPSIITRVPPAAKTIEELDAGYVIDYSKDRFVEAVEAMLADEQGYRKKRENAIMFASNFSWNVIFEKAFRELASERAEAAPTRQ